MEEYLSYEAASRLLLRLNGVELRLAASYHVFWFSSSLLILVFQLPTYRIQCIYSVLVFLVLFYVIVFISLLRRTRKSPVRTGFIDV